MKTLTLLLLYGAILGFIIGICLAVVAWPKEPFCPIVEHSEITKTTLDTTK